MKEMTLSQTFGSLLACQRELIKILKAILPLQRKTLQKFENTTVPRKLLLQMLKNGLAHQKVKEYLSLMSVTPLLQFVPGPLLRTPACVLLQV